MRPNDQRGFLHKSKFGGFLGGIAGKVVGTVPLVGGFAEDLITGFTGAPRRRSFGGRRPKLPQTFTPQFAPPITQLPIATPGSDAPCNPGESVRCCRLRNGTFSDQRQWQRECGTAGEQQGGGNGFGEAEMGQFGAGLQPSTFTTTTRACPRGAVLAVDGLCYNKRDLRNADRMWPRGTRPLLTGGEMRCIRIASGASKKLQRKQKQLIAMGMLPKPSRRTQRALPSGHHAHVAHD